MPEPLSRTDRRTHTPLAQARIWIARDFDTTRTDSAALFTMFSTS